MKVCPSVNDLEKHPVLQCYAAFSNNSEIRFNSSSGGFVTQFVIDLLENSIIDGAIVCDYTNDVFAPQAILAQTREEVIRASTSKYCPVPMNLILKDIHEGHYAFVGLPCHIKSLRLYQNIDQNIRDCILLAIGLFCNHTPKFEATDFILHNLRIKKTDVQKIRYRGNGWPGLMQVTMNHGQIVIIKNLWETGFGKYFIPSACLYCTDVFSDYADISAGDPWLPEYYSDKSGTTFIITRNKSSIQLIEGSKGISLKEVSFDKIFESQKVLYDKKVKRKNFRKRRLQTMLGNNRMMWRILYKKSMLKQLLTRQMNSLK
jgi:coenzyme F420 hydrogenase subunit beta